MISLSERIANLKADSSSKPFPLATFITIYNKASCECYIDYMEGAKALHFWLTAGGTIPLDLELSSDAALDTPNLLISYSMTELVKIIIPSLDLEKRNRVYKAILLILCKDLIQ